MRLYFFPVVLLMLLSVAGCQQATMVRGGEPVPVAGGAYTVLPWGNWTRTDVENEERWTQNGPLLDRMVFYEPVGDGETLFDAKPGNEGEDGPEFYADMSMLEIGEFVVGSLTFRDLQDVRAGQLSAASFGSQPGFHQEITAYTTNGLKMEGFARGIIHDGKLYLVTFLAPSLHYHAAVRQDAEFLADSVWPAWEEGARPEPVRREARPQSAAATPTARSPAPSPRKTETPPASSVSPAPSRSPAPSEAKPSEDKPSAAAPSEAKAVAAAPLRAKPSATPAAKTSRTVDAQAREQAAELRQFESKLASSKAQLVPILDRYNKDAEFKTSSHQPGTRLNIEDVSRVTVLGRRGEGYVVRVVGNSGIAASWSKEVYDETFLIREQYGTYQILNHGQGLVPESGRHAFEDRLRSSQVQLVALLNSYNRSHDFAMSGMVYRRLTIKDVAKLQVHYERNDGYVVRIVGNASLGDSWGDEVYDERFLIQERNGVYLIRGHGPGITPESSDYAFEVRLRDAKDQLVAPLNSYNRDNEFALSQHSGKRLNITEVSELWVVDNRERGHVVRIVGTSTVARSFSSEVFNEYFLIQELNGAYLILDHGQALAPQKPRTTTVAATQNRPTKQKPKRKLSHGSDLYDFEAKLKDSTDRLLGQLNKYNRETEFAVTADRTARLDIKEVTRLRVLSSRNDGYVVQVIGKAGFAESASDRVYDEYFVIEDREDSFRIVAHLQ